MAKIVAENDYTPSELLDLVNEAIAKLMAGGQSYGIGSQTFTRADLTALKEFRVELQQQIAEESSGGPIAFAKIERRRTSW